ncbi:MAG: DUF1295 domain-containing protein [Acidobacteriota bacterium]|nr:MAG: DUF1295 domain-containing protein [Acidobacteriota bacterium]
MSSPVDGFFLLAGALALACAGMLVLYLLQRRWNEADVVDFGWSAGIGLATVGYAVLANGYPLRRGLIAVMVTGWSFRLAIYLLRDRVLRAGEDTRYRELRSRWGARAQSYFLLFFLFQALLVVVFTIPPLVAMGARVQALGIWDALGAAVWFVALAGESAADRQLARFRARPESRGKTCREGLWRYSRHPNYFFEWVHWWAYVVIGWRAPFGWLTLLGPALMLLFLYKVTGVPIAERRALETRPDYRDYQRTTSAFIPWPPRTKS